MNNSETVESIKHSGVITAVNPSRRTVTVSLDGAQDCGGCPASTLCHAVGDAANRVEVPVASVNRFKVGDGVVLEGSERLHRKAIMLATVIPSIVLIVVMTALFLLTGSQLTACLGGLGSMVLFFIILWLIRDRLAHEFVFEITEIDIPDDDERLADKTFRNK